MNGAGCAGHASLAEDLRGYADGALDLLEPLMERIRERPADAAHPEPTSCAACPVCAVITVLRGGRSELAVRLAEQASEMLAVLRIALSEGAGAQQPGAQQPGAQQPGAQQPGAQQPGAQQPGAQQPGAQQPGAQQAGARSGSQPAATSHTEPQRAHRGSAYRTPKVQHISVARR